MVDLDMISFLLVRMYSEINIVTEDLVVSFP